MTNKYINFLVVLLYSTVLSAQETTGYSLSVAGVGMSMDYSEYLDDASLFNTEESDLNGIIGLELKLAYIEVLESQNYSQIGVSLEILGGETQYTGAYMGNEFGTLLSATKDTIIDMEIEYKFIYLLDDNLELMCGVGVGYREWNRELSSTQIEIYSWYSLRPKIGLIYNTDVLSLGINLEYQYAINPQMLILANSLNPDTTVNLGSANIVEFSVPLTFKYSEKIHLFLEYSYQYQNIEKSDKAAYSFYDELGTIVEGAVWEPRSEAYNQYIKFGAEFKF